MKDSLHTAREEPVDPTRDELYAELCAIGLDARLAERGKPEEQVVGRKGAEYTKIARTLWPKSLGLIEIRGSPIRWINVLKQGQTFTGMFAPDGYVHASYIYSNVYLVPDKTILVVGHMESRCVSTVPLFGKVGRIRWKGNLKDLVALMDRDMLLKYYLLRMEDEIDIYSYPEHRCWAMLSKRYQWAPYSLGQNQFQPPPSREKWDYYERMAGHLLESSRK